MMFDLFSIMTMAAVVVNVSGIVFVVETLLRRDEGAGRVWTLAFLAGMLTTLSYLVWIQTPGAWYAIAVGNAAFVGATGCMWLGCRRFNDRRMPVASAVVVAGVLAAAVAAAIEGPSGDPWAGAEWMFAALVVFAAAGAVECGRGALRDSRSAWVLGAVLGLQSLYYVSRTTAFLTSGPDSALFREAFGTVPTAFLTVVLTIVAVVVASVLRAGRAPMRGHLRLTPAGRSVDGIVAADVFRRGLAGLVERAAAKRESVAVTAVRIEDLDEISTAFGSEVARAVTETWRAGVRRHAPSDALVGDDGPARLLVAGLVSSDAQAGMKGAEIYRGLFEDLGAVAGGVIPVLGVGIALTAVSGWDPERLIADARAAAATSASNVEASVLFAERRDGDDQAAVRR
ncbi:hypothetical protein [Microbacterium aureliae]